MSRAEARRPWLALLQDLLGACVKSIRGGGKLMFFGNGGSAADAQHLATELTVRYKSDRAAIAAHCLDHRQLGAHRRRQRSRL